MVGEAGPVVQGRRMIHTPFNYTGAYPEYTLQPKVQASVRARSIGL